MDDRSARGAATGRACKAICGSCGTRATVLISNGRIGLSTWTSPGGIVERAAADEVIDLDENVRDWPPCPGCFKQRLRRDPDGTDMLFTDDLPPALAGSGKTGRRRYER